VLTGIWAAFFATEGGSRGPTLAATGVSVSGLTAGCAGGGRLVVWPSGFVTVMMLVVLLITTVL
jgi:hypothetical protein